ncbi:MAG: hypothetical protein DRO99_01055 [Candidatus Aenigmatarchaeota archaeon]|nr:MAG: hypothetical protein DRO99_01055 [Candidatus Aenigmarchaeota archaeon]
METSDCINTRATVREYDTKEISDDIIKDLIAAATRAPSSGNVQDWEFVIVKTPEGKKALASAAFEQSFIERSPVVVVACANLEASARAYGERGKSLYSIQNVSAAVENMLLAAWDKGIGGCWVGAFSEDAVRDAVVMPTETRPLALITLGYPANRPPASRREPVEDVIHWETF